MLRTRRQHDVLGIGRHAEMLQPGGHRLAVPKMSTSRRVAKQLRPRQCAPLEEMRGERCDLFVRHQEVDAEVEDAVLAGRIVVRLLTADERAATDVAIDQAASRRFGVGTGDRRHRDPEVVGQITMRRQFRPCAQRAVLHVLIDGVGNRPIYGPFSRLEIRQPHCHCSNIRIAALSIHLSY